MSPDQHVTPAPSRPPASLPGADVVFVAIGAAVTAAEVVGATARFALGTLRRVPGLARRLDATIGRTATRGLGR